MKRYVSDAFFLMNNVNEYTRFFFLFEKKKSEDRKTVEWLDRSQSASEGFGFGSISKIRVRNNTSLIISFVFIFFFFFAISPTEYASDVLRTKQELFIVLYLYMRLNPATSCGATTGVWNRFEMRALEGYTASCTFSWLKFIIYLSPSVRDKKKKKS